MAMRRFLASRTGKLAGFVIALLRFVNVLMLFKIGDINFVCLVLTGDVVLVLGMDIWCFFGFGSTAETLDCCGERAELVGA